jgi:MraZ protein
MFLSSYENKIDKKGRVSVPATFRSHLSSMGYNGFISYPSFNHSALEACSQDRIEKLSNTIDSLNPFEEKRDFFATSILSESENLQFDTEGRVSLSEKLLKSCKIKNNILFVGLGKTFQIWEPKILKNLKLLQEKKLIKIDLI